MTHKVRYTYTYRVPENPGYLSDYAWAAWLMYALLRASSYPVGIPPELEQGIQVLSDADSAGLIQATVECGFEFETIQIEGDITWVSMYHSGEWVRLFITVEEG